MSPSFTRWLRGLKFTLLGPRRNRPRPASRPTRAPRLAVESLEDRAVPAVHTWVNSGATNNWSDPGNWAFNSVPTSGEAGGTVVVFPSTFFPPKQDIVGLVVDRIEFGAGYGDGLYLTTSLGLNGSVSTNQLTHVGGENDIVTNTGGTSTINLLGNTAYFQIDAGRVGIHVGITGAQGIRKLGAGTLVLWADNTYTGITTVAAGTLRVNGNQGSSAVNLTGGTLGGSGTVGALTVTGGTVGLGVGGLSFYETLSTGSLSLNGGTFAPVILGSESDRLNVTGTVNLTGTTLNPTVINPIGVSAGASYTLISNDGADAITGTFNGLPQGAPVTVAGLTFTISYTGGDGNDVTLTLGTSSLLPASPPLPTPPPVYSNAFMFGDYLILMGAGLPGGFQFYQMPPGTQVLFADITGDGNSDVILFLPNMVVVLDGVTGKFVALSADLNGDGVRDLQVFNPDGSSTRTDGVTGMVF